MWRMQYSTWFGFVMLLGIILMAISCTTAKPSEVFENTDAKGDAIKRASFFVGSRYGRSYYGGRPQQNVNVAPRNDRFFFGSRYGKRSDEYMQDIVDPQPSKELTSTYLVSCVYTGVKDFYRCSKLNENINTDADTIHSNNE
ncbi:RYamide neuropeptides [Bradysia coprophila]|uniref:RYamide neuropeptides n=1 Tax=Bradysia coprophila TaxID=38358 RepID=UPI00187DA5C0|nr:RYamide neuropeptides [Bradysia coprophila]